ncbi:MAG: hypothetical protein HQM16_14580 [Deltaproteobacteria bacterium]|nr:hypothetical protein [Deltaproteobacteria bacterium]
MSSIEINPGIIFTAGMGTPTVGDTGFESSGGPVNGNAATADVHWDYNNDGGTRDSLEDGVSVVEGIVGGEKERCMHK